MTEVVWPCEVSGLPEGDLTVGAPFDLKCSGPDVQSLVATNLSLELPKPDAFRLKILENKTTTSTAVEFRVTSYMPGPTTLKEVILTDGTQRIKLTGIEFTVTSVIKEGEPPEPFPPQAPVDLAWPLWAWAAIGLAVTLVLVSILLIVRRRLNVQKFKAWLDSERTPLSPRDHLSRELRRAMKERDPKNQISVLETATRRFLSFEYSEPLMTASSRKILKTVLRRNPQDKKRLTPLTVRLFGEFERVSESLAAGKLSDQEALNVTLPQIHELTREFAESLSKPSKARR